MAKLINLYAFRKFFASSSAGGILLLISVVISLIIANTGLADNFQKLLDFQIGFESQNVHLNYSVNSWINDGLMAVFFLLVGLEIKREVVEGELSELSQAALPVLAALGGAILPAIIYGVINLNTPETSAGWGIPMATDIAFALGILSLLGNKVPYELKIFLAALAIADDLMAILVIAFFYTKELHTEYLLYAAGVFALQLLFNRMKLKSIWLYIIPGVFMWYFIHHSGIHATIAGVLTAFTLPTTPDDTESPLERLEHLLNTPVNFIIMPIFALANTNITFMEGMTGGLVSNMGLGIMLGLMFGKPIGILGISWAAVKLKLAKLPEETSWLHLTGAGILGGIGFTMSVFIALLSINNTELQNEAKAAILVASVISGCAGYFFLYRLNKRE